MEMQFTALYGEQAPQQRERYEAIRQGFAQYYGYQPQAGEFFSAPGRTEIGGNHTDHNHGRVIAGAVDLDIVGLVEKNDSGVIRLKSAEYDKLDTVDVSQLEIHQEDTGSQSLIRGICAKCVELGYQVGGLSSSAAFEVLVVTVLSHLYNDGKIDPITAAIISQYAENVYFGKPSGLLDQMASSVGGVTAMDFKDPAAPVVEKVEFDLASYGHALCVVDTGGNHADLTGDYASIPAEMKAVAQVFGKEFLRDVEEENFYRDLAKARAAAGDRAVLRAMHFFDDDRLAQEEAQALKEGDFETFLSLVNRSGQSSLMRLQNVFAPSQAKEQGITLALALSQRLLQGQGACRVHGGGFAGTIQAYVPFSLLESYRQGMESVFGAGSCYVLSFRQAGGAKVLL